MFVVGPPSPNNPNQLKNRPCHRNHSSSLIRRFSRRAATTPTNLKSFIETTLSQQFGQPCCRREGIQNSWNVQKLSRDFGPNLLEFHVWKSGADASLGTVLLRVRDDAFVLLKHPVHTAYAVSEEAARALLSEMIAGFVTVTDEQ